MVETAHGHIDHALIPWLTFQRRLDRRDRPYYGTTLPGPLEGDQHLGVYLFPHEDLTRGRYFLLTEIPAAKPAPSLRRLALFPKFRSEDGLYFLSGRDGLSFLLAFLSPNPHPRGPHLRTYHSLHEPRGWTWVKPDQPLPF